MARKLVPSRGRDKSSGMGSTVAALALSAFMAGAGASNSPAQASIAPEELNGMIKPYRIPPGSMASALTSLADENGLHLLYDAQVTRGMRTSGLSGKYALREALDRLLAGTSLAYRLSGNGRAVSIVLAQNDTGVQTDAGGITLPTVDVTANQQGTGNGTGTGGGGTEGTGYSVPNAVSATKTDTPILNTPVSVQVVPRDVINDQQDLTVLQAVKNVSGVQTPPAAFYDSFLIRGFTTTSIYRNGLQLSYLSNAEDMAFIDRIEVVKGPASVLYGRIEPGGFVNVITRSPLDHPYYSLQQQGGSWGELRTVADATGPLNEDHTLLYRIIGVHDQADSFVNFAHHDNTAGAGFLTWRPINQFEFNLSLEEYDYKMTSPEGLGASGGEIPVIGNRPANLPRSFSSSDPVMWQDFPYKVDRTLVGFNWTYTPNDTWKLTQRFHYVTDYEAQTGLAFNGFNQKTDIIFPRRFTVNPLNRTIYGTNLDLTGKFATGPFEHKLLTGLDWYDYASPYYGLVGPDPKLGGLNIYNPIYGNLNAAYLSSRVNLASSNVLSRSSTDDFGLYAQDEITFDKNWIVLLGGRYDWANAQNSVVYGNTLSKCFPHCTGEPENLSNDRAFSPRAALLYKVTDNVSLYGSYAKSFGTNNGITATGQSAPPQVGIQYEIGAKAALLDGRVTTSLALYDLTKTNIPTPDPLDSNLSVYVGAARSQGVEFDISGQVTDHISLIGSYTYDAAVITKDNSGVQGNWLIGVPRNSANLWVKYDTAPGAKEGWAFGAGAYYVGQTQGDNANDYQLPAYDRYDAMASYHTLVAGLPLTFQVNIQNIFNRAYFVGSNGGASSKNGGLSAAAAYYGAPRTILGSIKVAF